MAQAPHIADVHTSRAQILTGLGRHEEAAAASIQADTYAPPRQLTELEWVMRGIGPKLSQQSSRALAEPPEVQEPECQTEDLPICRAPQQQSTACVSLSAASRAHWTSSANSIRLRPLDAPADLRLSGSIGVR